MSTKNDESAMGSYSATSGPKRPITFDSYPVSASFLKDLQDEGRPHWLVHFVRHAEGTHNVNKEYQDIANLDARLTPKGLEQCATLQRRLTTTSEDSREEALNEPHLVVTSTMTRCIQTALHCFPHIISSNSEKCDADTNGVPIVAHDDIRETVNHSCDRRRKITEIASDYSFVDFSHVVHDHDDIWKNYESDDRLSKSYNPIRESAELHKVAERGRLFFEWLFNADGHGHAAGHDEKERPKEVIVCSHSAFFRCIFGWGQSDGGILYMPPQSLDDRRAGMEDVPVFRYHSSPNDDSYDTAGRSFEQEMRRDYANCELRSCVVALPKDEQRS
jgi:broad specificity phosphatase PhoE